MLSALDESWQRIRSSEIGACSDQSDALVSVVIPIYNVADYLEECLDSVLSQTHANIEVICVNDGSTDGSLSIMRRYEKSDPRVRVIDKPNGGYGHSVNRGIEAATGEWLAIVEPDDFISKHMYSDLLKHATMDDGTIADIVKGSYWLYYDPKDGTKPTIERPHLTKVMPKYCTSCNVYEDPTLLRHHPSIWSAIYRRAFLDHFGIRMIEPQGAGWADNPWLYETLLSAQAVNWVPIGHYYYRKTNPNASSYLRDYHLPFDRLRDIRAIYEKRGIEDPNVLAALYHRSFFYILSTVLETESFNESDSELQSLIREVLESMDEDLVLNSPKKLISRRYKDYYADFMGKNIALMEEARSPEEGEAWQTPLISVIVPLEDDRTRFWLTVDALRSQTFEDYEVMFCDCGSKDRSVQIARDIAERDSRFVLVDTAGLPFDQAIDAAIGHSRGAWLYLLRAGIVLDKDAFAVLANALESGDLSRCQMLLLAKDYADETWKAVERSSEDVAWGTIPAYDNELLIAAAAPMDSSARLFARDFVVQKGIRYATEGDRNGYVFGIRSLLAAEYVGVVAGFGVKFTGRFDLDRQKWQSEEELVAYERKQIDALLHEVRPDYTEAETDVVRCCVIKLIALALGYVGRFKAHQMYYDYLYEVYSTQLDMAECSRTELGDYDAALRVEAAFGNTYEYYLSSNLNAAFNERRTARQQRNKAREDLDKLNRKVAKLEQLEADRAAKKRKSFLPSVKGKLKGIRGKATGTLGRFTER